MAADTATAKVKRKAPARQSQIVLGALEECLLAIGRARNLEDVAGHMVRVDELVDEIRRSFGKKEANPEREDAEAR